MGQAAAGIEQVSAARIAIQRTAGGHEPSGKGEHDEAWALRCHSDLFGVIAAQTGNGIFVVNDGTNAIDLFRR